MDSEDRFWPVVIAVLTFMVLAILGGCFIGCWHMHRMAELGYEEQIVPGRQSALWKKIAHPTVVVCDCGCPKVVPVSLASTNDLFSGWTGNIVTTNNLPVLKFENGHAIWE